MPKRLMHVVHQSNHCHRLNLNVLFLEVIQLVVMVEEQAVRCVHLEVLLLEEDLADLPIHL